MLRTIEQSKNIDAEARLLARVYALILTWSDDDQTHEPRDAGARHEKPRGESEDSNAEK